MARKILDTICIENARIRFRNFAGKEGRFNPAGKRNFCVFLDDELAQKLVDDGWNVRWWEPRGDEEGGSPQGYLQVAVSFGNIPPKIVMITGRGKTMLDERTVSALDWAEISEVDLILRPYNWDVNGKAGVKAYLKSMYVTISEDEFESKYYGIPTEDVGYEPDGD